MQITQEVRDYALQQGIEEQAALSSGLAAKAEEFLNNGAELYRRAAS